MSKKCKWQQFKSEKWNLTWVYGVTGSRQQEKWLQLIYEEQY